MNTLTYYINDLRERHGSLYDQIAVNVNFWGILQCIRIDECDEFWQSDGISGVC